MLTLTPYDIAEAADIPPAVNAPAAVADPAARPVGAVAVNNPDIPGIKNIAASNKSPANNFPSPLPEPAGTGVIITLSFATFK